MKGTIFVKELNKIGTFISEMDCDRHYIDEGNPQGRFKMVVQPIENWEGKNEIQYKKVDKGFLVDGEAYIITGKGEKTIDKIIEKDFGNDVFSNLVFIKNECLS